MHQLKLNSSRNLRVTIYIENCQLEVQSSTAEIVLRKVALSALNA